MKGSPAEHSGHRLGKHIKTPAGTYFCMDKSQTNTLRILVILAIILFTGVNVLSTNPELWWIYVILVAIVVVILVWQRMKASKQPPPSDATQ